MTIAPTHLGEIEAFTATWSAETADDDLQRWSAFLARHGITWSPAPEDRRLVSQLVGGSRAGLSIELRLSKLANDVLTRAGDARRVCKQISHEPERRWYVLSPEQRATLAASGQRFESGMEGTLRQLATIPITLGVFFGAQYACRVAGADPNVAWVVALVAYVLTVRVVRGRWPLQRS